MRTGTRTAAAFGLVLDHGGATVTGRTKNGRVVASSAPSATAHGKLAPTAPATREGHTRLRLLVRHIILRAVLDAAARRPDAAAADKRKALNNRKNASRLRSSLYALGPEMRERVTAVTDAFTSSAGSLLLTTIGRANVNAHAFALGAGELFFELYDEHQIRHAAPLALIASGAEELHLAKLLRSLAWSEHPAALTTTRSKDVDAKTTMRFTPGEALKLAATLSQVGRNNIATALALEEQARKAAASKPPNWAALLGPDAQDSGDGVRSPGRGDGPRGSFVHDPPTSPETDSDPEPDPDDGNHDSLSGTDPSARLQTSTVGDTHPTPKRAGEADTSGSNERRLSMSPLPPPDPAAAAYRAVVDGLRSRKQFP